MLVHFSSNGIVGKALPLYEEIFFIPRYGCYGLIVDKFETSCVYPGIFFPI